MIDTALRARHGNAGPSGSRATAAARARKLSIFMFSSFRIALGDEPLQRSLGAKGTPLLKILAAHRRRPVPRDALIEMLWPGTDPSMGATSLKVAAHNLRRVLEPDKQPGTSGTWVLFEMGTYRLNPDADIWLDVECMEQRARQGLAFEAAGDLRRARAEYESAEALYAGDFLEEDIYEDWTIIRREQLRDVYLEILGRLAHLSHTERDHRAVIKYSHKVIEADPCREDAYRMLMESHGALNQPARAGAWYAVCRTMLQREIGTGPAPETVQVFESLFAVH